MTYNKRNFIENKNTVIALLIPVVILAKLIEHMFLPDKYFNDSYRMLMMMIEKDYAHAWEGSYRVTVNVFTKINLFNFHTLLQWSIFVAIIFNILLIVMMTKVKGIDLMQSIFALLCIGLCNIYIFNLGKDIIQYCLFLMCYLIILIDRIPTWIKVVGCTLVFYWESTFFRNYYVIMAAFTIGVCLIFAVVRRKKSS